MAAARKKGKKKNHNTHTPTSHESYRVEEAKIVQNSLLL
jgi:hypothetical protein